MLLWDYSMAVLLLTFFCFYSSIRLVPPINLYNCLFISLVRYFYIVVVYNIFLNVNNIENEIPALGENVYKETTNHLGPEFYARTGSTFILVREYYFT